MSGVKWDLVGRSVAVSSMVSEVHGEDAHCVVSGLNRVWVVVADGAGGRPDAASCAGIAAATAADALVNAVVGVPAVDGALTAALKAVRNAVAAGALAPSATSTLTVLGTTTERTIVASKGDSPVWLVDNTGPRKVTGQAPFLSMMEEARYDVIELPGLSAAELLVIASDGLEPGMRALAGAPYLGPDGWQAHELVRLSREAEAFDGSSPDDITVVTVSMPVSIVADRVW